MIAFRIFTTDIIVQTLIYTMKPQFKSKFYYTLVHYLHLCNLVHRFYCLWYYVFICFNFYVNLCLINYYLTNIINNTSNTQ